MISKHFFIAILPLGLFFSNSAYASELVNYDQPPQVAKLQALANHGDVKAQLKLATVYYSGQGEPQNNAQVRNGEHKTAANSYAGENHNLGLMYALGKGVPQNYAEAWKWRHRAAEKEGTAAENSYAGENHNLGLMYALGIGVPQNYAEAWKWRHRAAEKEGTTTENSYAGENHNLGLMYALGKGVPQNYAEAWKWRHKAAEEHALAKNRVRQNYVQALKWALIAKAEGNHDAIHDVSLIEGKATPAQIARGQAMAHRWETNHLQY